MTGDPVVRRDRRPLEWAPNVPADWEVARLSSRYEVFLGKMLSPEAAAGPHQRPYVGNVHVQWDRVVSDQLPTMSISPSEFERFRLRAGDLLVCEGGEVGRTAIWRDEVQGCCYQKALHRIRPLRDREVPRFLYYLMSAATWLGVFESGGNRSTIVHLTGEQLRAHRFPFPSSALQKQIANFLDRKTAAIDDLIAKKERLIALLAQKRQTTITQAVTRGFDPRARRASTGVEWFGAIPSHWQILPLRRVVRSFVDYRGRTPTKTADGIPLITAGAVRDGVIDHARAPEYMAESELEKVMSRGQPEVGDLVFTTEAPLGEVGLVEDVNVAFAQRIILFKIHTRRMSSRYLRLYYLSEAGKAEVLARASGSTAEGIRADRLRASLVVVPPLSEQYQVVDALEPELRNNRCQVELIARQISSIKEYRQALIIAAVTGQIDVTREVA